MVLGYHHFRNLQFLTPWTKRWHVETCCFGGLKKTFAECCQWPHYFRQLTLKLTEQSNHPTPKHGNLQTCAGSLAHWLLQGSDWTALQMLSFADRLASWLLPGSDWNHLQILRFAECLVSWLRPCSYWTSFQMLSFADCLTSRLLPCSDWNHLQILSFAERLAKWLQSNSG